MFWNPLLTLGAGVGIEIRGEDLVVTLVRSRWKGVSVAGLTRLRDFRRRPAAEWGREYREFLKSHGFGDLPATLALPRSEVIVRLLNLPAVARAKLREALRYQVDSMHPYGEEEVYFSFAPLERAAGGPSGPSLSGGQPSIAVAMVIAARSVVDGYADRLEEAGVKLGGCTVAAAAYYGAVRLLRRASRPARFLLADQQDSALELYGESPTRPFFSATFGPGAMPLEKAVAAAAAELRLAEEEALPLLVCGEATGDSPLGAEEILGSPIDRPADFDLRRDAAAFVTGLAAACPRWGWRANLLPAARRSSSARWPLAATAAMAVVTAAIALLFWVHGPFADRRYAQALQEEAKRLETVEREVRALERQGERARARRAQMESFRRRGEADLILVTELSRRLPKTVWLNSIEAAEDSVQLIGQADAAAPLLGLLDESGVLTGAAFASSITRSENREIFRVRAARRAGVSLPPATAAAPPGPAAASPVAPSGPAAAHTSPAPHAAASAAPAAGHTAH